jgi:hypothetical protein
LGTPFENPFDAMHKAPGFTVSGLKSAVSEKQFQHVNVNILGQCKESMCNKRQHFQHLL